MALTPEQQADIVRYDAFLRGVFSSLANLAKQADADAWNQFAIDNVDVVLAALNDADILPTQTGLGGAKPLTVAEFKVLQSMARVLKQMLDGNRALFVKAVGVNA